MILIKELLEKRIAELQKLIDIIESRIDNYPSGRLRISSNGKMTTYLFCDESSKIKYISKSNKQLISELAQKDYDIKVLKAFKQELKHIKVFMQTQNSKSAIEIFNRLSDERKSLINPLVLNDEALISKWNHEEYEGLSINSNAVTYTTNRGELVRSKSEKILADKFFSEGIPYHYEYPVYLKGIGTVHPDFKVLNVRTRKVYFWEHLGMMDDSNYAIRNVKKINAYIKNGYYSGENIIYSYEIKNYFDLNAIDDLVKRYLK